MKTIFTALTVLLFTGISAQGIKGFVTDENGAPLAFATIYIEDVQSGTAANEDGNYQIRLSPGIYRVRYQFLGYKSVTKTVTVKSRFEVVDVQIFPEPIMLQEAIVSSDREDAAYTIMRKAIAKAKFHTQQIDEYTTTVYLKGSGRLLKSPSLIFFKKKIEKALKEEGIDSTTAFVTESVSEISYKRPNTYSERVISVRTIGDDNNTNPTDFISSSFYEPVVATAISPLSPKAFAHYKFEYLGNFSDQNKVINKIKVTPRSRGDQVFEGTIYIVDGDWAIHSLDLATYIWGIKFNINQVYAAVVENAWLPINQIFDINGSVFGFKFEYKYLANMRDYVIVLNPDLEVELTVIDDKLEKELSKEADRILKDENFETLSELENGKEVSRKQLNKLLKEYEKAEQAEAEAESDTLVDVISIRDFSIDSLAGKRDSMYWETIRPIPLSEYEVKGYRKLDSMAVVYQVEAEEAAGDTMQLTIGSDGSSVQRSRKTSKFKLEDLLLGGSYKLDPNLNLSYTGLLSKSHFNTVDGYNAEVGLSIYNSSKKKVQFSVEPAVRYAFAREQFGYTLTNTYAWGKKRRRSNLTFSGGRGIDQLNTDDPINPWVNDFMTILFERNYMKIFEKDFVLASYQKDLSDKFSFGFDVEWAKRYPLDNNSDYVLFDSKRRTYTSNIPYNAEIGDTKFETHKAFTTNLTVEARPWLKYRIRNGRKSIIDGSSAILSLRLRSGWKGVGDSQVDYQNLELGVKHVVRVGAGSDLTFNVIAGFYPSNNASYFQDFKHFAANKTPFATLDPTKSFRMLDFYALSTESEYLNVFAHYQFRKFLLTQIPLVRITGIREGFFLNSLETKSSDHYMELGYNINYIFRFFRIEAVTQWQDFKYQRLGIRIGIASNLNTLFN